MKRLENILYFPYKMNRKNRKTFSKNVKKSVLLYGMYNFYPRIVTRSSWKRKKDEYL